MSRKNFIIILAMALLSWGCGAPSSENMEKGGAVPMYPDYTDILIPVNIAPLNFLLRGEFSHVEVSVNGERVAGVRGGKVTFGDRKWRRLLEKNVGKEMEVAVCAREKGVWKEFTHFKWTVSGDRVDPYLTYRIIEPDYEAFNAIALEQRCVENFEKIKFSDCRVIGNKCMNCHTYANQNPDTSMFYVRGEGGGAMLNIDGHLRKLALKGDGMVSGSVYFGFSPSRRYVVFSTNVIIPGYHSQADRRMEIYDTESDVYVADLENHRFLTAPQVARKDVLETFPCFSPDGRSVYYCGVETLDTFDLNGIRELRYSLCRVDFDEVSGGLGSGIDTVYNGQKEGHSVCHPRISPDGKFICFSVADYGTFPLWHKESDLLLMNLETREQIPMTAANSDKSDTYHSWSSSSKWLVFASKRDDGVYGKPYFTHIDEKGNCSKAFVLPQEHPDFYDNYLRSFNAPEFGTGPLPFNSFDVREVMKTEAEPFNF